MENVNTIEEFDAMLADHSYEMRMSRYMKREMQDVEPTWGARSSGDDVEREDEDETFEEPMFIDPPKPAAAPAPKGFHYTPSYGAKGANRDTATLARKEWADVEAARLILANWDALFASGHLGIGVWKMAAVYNTKVDNQARTCDEGRAVFASYVNKLIQCRGHVRVEYRQTPSGFGRYYAKGSVGMASFARSLRHTLAHALYHDIDMSNCHPRIMVWLAEKHGLKTTSHLKRYLANREEYLAHIQGLLGCSRDDAKQHVLSWAYGRDLGSLVRSTGALADAARLIMGDSKASQLYWSIRLTNEELAAHYPEKEEECRLSNKNSKSPIPRAEDWNLQCKMASRVILDVENDLLLSMDEYLRAHGLEADVLIFDGFQIRKDSLQAKGWTVDYLMRQLEAYVHAHPQFAGLDMRLETKEMDKVIDLSHLAPLPSVEAVEEAKSQEAKKARLDALPSSYTIGPYTVTDEAFGPLCWSLLITKEQKKSQDPVRLMAKLFAQVIHGHFVWAAIGKKLHLFQWNGKYWKEAPDSADFVYKCLVDAYECFTEWLYDFCMAPIRENQNKPEDKRDPGLKFDIKLWKKLISPSGSDGRKRVLQELRTVMTPVTEWNDLVSRIQFENCLFDADTGMFHETCDPAWYVNRSNGITLGAAPQEHVDRVRAYIRGLVPGEPEYQFLTAWMGSLLWRCNEEQIGVFLTGVGSNGKTMLLETLQAALGEEYQTMSAAFLTEESRTGACPDLYECRHARLVVFNEMSVETRIKDDRFKNLLDGSSQKTRTLWQAEMTKISMPHVAFAVNEMPGFTGGMTNAVERRVAQLPFLNEYKIPSKYDPTNPRHRLRDDALKAWLRSEEGINAMWHFITGECRDNYLSAPKGDRLAPTETMEAALAETKEDQNPVATWLRTRFVKTDSPSDKWTMKYLTEKYNEDAKKMGEAQVQPKIMGAKITELGWPKKRMTDGWNLVGYSWAPRSGQSEA